ncbi:MAG: prepilin peptidase [Pirellulaceae bacterium]
MFSVIAILTIVLLVIATICDLRTREIPDWISIAIGLMAVVGSLTGLLDLSIQWVVAGGVVGLLIGYGLFRYARLGGGDAKLIASLGMLLGPVGILVLLFGMAVFGGVLALIAIYRGQQDYAYAPAITAGFVWYVGFVSTVTGG